MKAVGCWIFAPADKAGCAVAIAMAAVVPAKAVLVVLAKTGAAFRIPCPRVSSKAFPDRVSLDNGPSLASEPGNSLATQPKLSLTASYASLETDLIPLTRVWRIFFPLSSRSRLPRILVTGSQACIIQPAGVKFKNANLATLRPNSMDPPMASPIFRPMLAAF